MRPPSKTSRLAALLLAGALAAPATTTARAADAAGADRLRDQLEAYLGHPRPGEPSAITVTALGDDYELAIDFDRLAAPLRGLGFEMKLGRSLSRLAPRPDGTWVWRSDRFEPISWTYQGQTGRVAFEGWRAEGDFSPALSAFTRQTLKADRVIVEQSVPAADDKPRVDIRKTDEGLEMKVAATPATGGAGVDVTLEQTTRATIETFGLTEGKAAGVPDMEATLKVGPTRLAASWQGLRTEALLGLWRHLVAHHDPADFTTGQVAFKTAIRDLGPLFERLNHRFTIDSVEVETPVGFGSIGRVEATVDAAGATAAGRADVAVTLTGFEMHSLFIPAWANRLIPRDLVLHAEVAGWDAAAALTAFLDRADFAAEKPLDDAGAAAVLAGLLPKGTVTIDLAGNRLKSTDWDVSLDGRLVAGSAGVDGEITLRAVGLEAAATALRDPAAGEAGKTAADQIALALAFAETENGRLTWRFAFHGPDVSVNGRSLTSAPGSQAAPKSPAAKDAGPSVGKKGVPAHQEEEDDSEDDSTPAGSSIKGGSTKK